MKASKGPDASVARNVARVTAASAFETRVLLDTPGFCITIFRNSCLAWSCKGGKHERMAAVEPPPTVEAGVDGE
jgi:hypothetical protein